MYEIKFQIKFHGWWLFYPKYSGNFIHESSSIENSWMITHECSFIKYETICSTIMSSSLYLFPNSTLPNGLGYYLTILQNPLYLVVKVHFAKSHSQQCSIVKSMLPNQHCQGTNSTSTRQYCQIVKFKFTKWTAQMSHHIKNLWAVLCLRSTEISAQKIKLPWSATLPPPLQDFSLHYYFLTWWLFEAREESFQNSNYPIN